MLNGLYSSASAMDVATTQHEVIANNLANVNSAGFRRTIAAFTTRDPTGNGAAMTLNGAKVAASHIDFSPGQVRSTDRKLDVAIVGDGFFTVEAPNETLYTRSGNFHLSETGQVVTSDGMPVLAGGSPIVIPTEVGFDKIKIGPDGSIQVGAEQVGTFDIVIFDNPQLLERAGFNRFRAPPQATSTNKPAIVQQGALEMSNTSAVTEMIQMITGMRHFEAAQRTLRSISEAIAQYTNMDT